MISKLSTLIRQFGEPSALIDHRENSDNRFAIWGFEETIYLQNGKCYLNDEVIAGNPLVLLQKQFDKWKTIGNNVWGVGFFSYDFKQSLFPHRHFKQNQNNIPDFWFAKPKIIKQYRELDITTSKTKISLISDIPNKAVYLKDISIIKNYLEDGDVYQINYTHPKRFKTDSNPLDLYASIAKSAKPLFGYFINTSNFQVLSFSPERFYRVDKNIIDTFPIKGTRPRGENQLEDEQLILELSKSEKDRAEHLMIVDLLRNDVGKICNYGTVEVKDLYKVCSFETVHHMVTQVLGNLMGSVAETDIIKAMFPGGSITGAPKERAMEIIDEIENYNRGIYTGAIGYFKGDDYQDFNIAIRTMILQNNNATYPVGGGIVWDSNSDNEWEEAHQKGVILNQIIDKNYQLK
jgi:aminodeoxychorismate synthase component I